MVLKEVPNHLTALVNLLISYMNKTYATALTTILLLIVGSMYFNKNKNENSRSQIRVAINLELVSFPIDPLHNPTLSNAFYTNHLYSNLIDVDNNNIYIPDLASAFYWDQNKLIFDFPVKTNKSAIDAKDAEFSIRRSIFNELNDHADLWQAICDINESKENCITRIYEKNGQLIIEIQNEEMKSLIVPILASINYKIIPQIAFNSTDYKAAKIVDFSKTSGHYFLKPDTNNVLYATEKTLSTFPNAPAELILINSNPNQILSDISKHDIDVISTTIPITEPIFNELAQLKWNTFNTFPISIGLLVFSQKALKKTTVEDRFHVGSLIRKVLEKNKIFSSEETPEFLQYFGEGNLTDEQKAMVTSLRNTDYKKALPHLRLGIGTPAKWKSLHEAEKNIELIQLTKSANTLPEKDKPDLYLLSNDVSFDVSFSLFSFAVKNSLLSLENNTPVELVEKFISHKTNEKRVSFINSIHFDSIKNCRIYPIWSSPYFTAARANIVMNLSKYNSRTLMWKLEIN